MDVGSLGAQYLDQNRFSLESLSIVRSSAGNSSVTGGSFADILTKAQNDESETFPSSIGNSHKAKIDKTGKLYEQCEALETFLVKNLITGMRNTVQKSGLLDQGFAGEMYEDMLYDEYTKDFTKNANFGLADIAYLELTGQRGKLIADHP
ncbi:flagellar protein [Spirochaetia bacterium]|nr:flagellar protein [Spirochaetia bacterium]